MRPSPRLAALIGGLLASMLLAGAAVALVYLWPPIRSISPNAVVVTLPAAISGLQTGEAERVGVTRSGAWLVRTPGGLRLLWARDTAAGCSVTFRPESGTFFDLCHGSTYGLDGSVLHGPAIKPLVPLSWRRLDDRRIAVTPPG